MSVWAVSIHDIEDGSAEFAFSSSEDAWAAFRLLDADGDGRHRYVYEVPLFGSLAEWEATQ